MVMPSWSQSRLVARLRSCLEFFYPSTYRVGAGGAGEENGPIVTSFSSLAAYERYKYAWSANIDYVYDHAWTLYAHVGAINVKPRQRFDDVVVYNYKYSVETELAGELRDAALTRSNVDPDYEEPGLGRRVVLRRKDPLRVPMELGRRKVTWPRRGPVHEDARAFEEWFDRPPVARCRNCVLRTARFALAFWRDGLFWYLYNPYRCDEFGLWCDRGRACVVRFCSRESLRRHLTILLLRAHARETPDEPAPADREDRPDDVPGDVQIYRVTFHCCRLRDPEQRRAPRPPRHGPQPSRVRDLGDLEEEEEEKDDDDFRRERPEWLKRMRVTWTRCAAARRCTTLAAKVAARAGRKTPRWHHYYVEEPGRLFSLWGGLRVERAGSRVTRACYAVCAGMTRLTAPEYWSPRVLDAIVVCGERYCARGRDGRFEIGRIAFDVRTLPAIGGALYARSDRCLWRTVRRALDDHHFAVLTCESSCLGLFKFCGAYYACDVGSHGPPLFRHGHGAPYLLRATSYRRFLTALVLTIGSPEPSPFAVIPVEILRVVEPRDLATALERGKRPGVRAARRTRRRRETAPKTFAYRTCDSSTRRKR